MFGRFLWILLGLSTAAWAGELSTSQQRVLAGIARERFSGRWTDLDTNQLRELRRKAEAYDERLRDRHLPGGMVVSLRFATTNSPEPISYEALENSSAWTGLYLTACSYRWAVLHESRSLGDVRLVLEGITRAARSTGRPGVLPRFAGRAADDLYKPVYSRFGGEDPKRPGYGRLAYRGEGEQANLVWLGGPNRDDYAAVNLGLATAWFYLRDAKIRGQISNVVVEVVSRMESDGWRLDDGKGNVTFADPMLVAAWLRTAATVNPKAFAEKYDRQVADLIRLREDAELPETGFPRYGDIRPAFFRLVNILSLNRNETNQSRRIAFQDRIAKMWQRTSSGLNPWPAVAFLSAFERIPVDSTARAVIQGVLHEYPDPPRWSASRDLGGDLQVERIEADGRSHARYSQPLGKRPVFPFQWAESGTWLEGGKDEPVMHPGVDLLLPYWIGRDVAVTPSEDSIAPLDLKLRPQTGLGGKTNSTVSTNLPRRPGPAPRAPTGASNSPARR